MYLTKKRALVNRPARKQESLRFIEFGFCDPRRTTIDYNSEHEEANFGMFLLEYYLLFVRLRSETDGYADVDSDPGSDGDAGNYVDAHAAAVGRDC